MTTPIPARPHRSPNLDQQPCLADALARVVVCVLFGMIVVGGTIVWVVERAVKMSAPSVPGSEE